MPFSFFRPKAEHPIRVPLPEMLNIGFGVYFRENRQPVPDADALRVYVGDWLERHAVDPFRSALRAWMDKGLLNLHVGEKSMLPAPPVDLLRHMGADEELLRRFQDSTRLVVVSSPDPVGPPHLGLWCADAAARATAETLDGAILDPELPRLLPTASHEESLPADLRLTVSDRIIIPFSVNERGLGWMTTKGMGKFGLPELQIQDVPLNLQGPLGQVVNGTARQLLRLLAEVCGPRQRPPRELVLGPEIRLSLEDLAEREVEGPVELPDGTRGWTMIRLQFQPGRRGASSFLTFSPPPGFRGGSGVWLNSLLTDLLGNEDTLRTVGADSEAMEAAHLRAVAELPAARRRFQAGLGPGETLFVKHGFPTDDDGHEYMWLVVSGWTGDRIHGQLANDPQWRMDLRAGQEIELCEAQVYDWMLSLPDDRREGGYTSAMAQREGRNS